MHGDVFFDAAAGVLVVGELLLRGGDLLAGGFEARIERRSRSGSSARRCSASWAVGIEPLQRDQSFEISVHGVQQT